METNVNSLEKSTLEKSVDADLKKLNKEDENKIKFHVDDMLGKDLVDEDLKKNWKVDEDGYLAPTYENRVENVKDLLKVEWKIKWNVDLKWLNKITDEEAIFLSQKVDGLVDIDRKILSDRWLAALQGKIFDVEIQKDINPSDFEDLNILKRWKHEKWAEDLLKVEWKIKWNVDLKWLNKITDEEAIFLSQKVDGLVDIDRKILSDRWLAALQGKIFDVEIQKDINPQEFRNPNILK